MLKPLPEIKHKKYTNANCMYGFNNILSEYLDVNDINFSAFSWSHGWIADAFKVNPQDVICGRGNESKEELIFVARHDQCHYLASHGFNRTVAAGLPISYVEEQSVDRIPNSLLIMPVHTGSNTFLIGEFASYTQYLRSLKQNYDYMAACIHPSCLTKGYWVKEFSNLDIPIIAGSSFQDENGLLRIVHILSSFETMTTNGFGSHIAYAAALGCRVSVFDPFEDALKHTYDHHFQTKSQMAEICSKLTYKNIHKVFPFLLADPLHARTHIEWGKFQIGSNNKKKSEELVEILPRLKKNIYFFSHASKIVHNMKQSLKPYLRSQSQLLYAFCLNLERQLDEESLSHYAKPKILKNVPILGDCFISQNSDLTSIVNIYINDLYSLEGIDADCIVDICPDSGLRCLHLAQQHTHKAFYLFAQTNLSYHTIQLNHERSHLANLSVKRLNISICSSMQAYYLSLFYPNRYELNTLLDNINHSGSTSSFPDATAHIQGSLCLCLKIISHEITVWSKWFINLERRPEYLMIDFYETIGNSNKLQLLLASLDQLSYKYFCHSVELASASNLHKPLSSSYPFHDAHYVIKAYSINHL